ncbi:MAG: FixH family protein, partial [Chloroflexi bacterium]|nr:FixH family protein [Chloroflexota bacterium]
MKQLILMGFVLLACTMLVACGREKSTSNTSNLNVTLIPTPGQAIIVQLTDASGQPVNDAVVSIEGNMQHAGMAPVTA